MDKPLTDQVALITGAGQGVGQVSPSDWLNAAFVLLRWVEPWQM